MKDINKELKNIREDKDLTTGYMAERLNMSQTNYSRIENGNVRLTIDVFLDICKILNVNPKSFFDDFDENTISLTDEEIDVINKANKVINSKILNITNK